MCPDKARIIHEFLLNIHQGLVFEKEKSRLGDNSTFRSGPRWRLMLIAVIVSLRVRVVLHWAVAPDEACRTRRHCWGVRAFGTQSVRNQREICLSALVSLV